MMLPNGIKRRAKKLYLALFGRIAIRYATRRFRKMNHSLSNLSDAVSLSFEFNHLGIFFFPVQIREEIQRFLEVAKEIEPRTIVEIGTAKGGTFYLLAKIADKKAKLISIDLPGGPFGGGYERWRIPLIQSFAQDSQEIVLLREDSHKEETIQKLKDILGGGGIDLLFIDGDHRYESVRKDFEMYSPLVRKGGIIAFHDICPGPPDMVGEVPSFWKETMGKYRNISIVKDQSQCGDGIGVLFSDGKLSIPLTTLPSGVTISVVCVYNDSRTLEEYLLRSLKNQRSPYEYIGIDNTNEKYRSAASVLNDGAKGGTSDYFMFAHQDVLFSSSDWLEQVEILLRNIPDLGVAGVAGAIGKRGYSDSISNITNGKPPRRVSEKVITRPTPVQTVDECLFIVPRKVLEKIQFDEINCNGWHLYAADLCLTCGEQGLANYVLPVTMYHRSDGRSMSPDYFDTISKLYRKHRGKYPWIGTTCTTWNVWIDLVYRTYRPIRPILHRHLPRMSRVESLISNRLR